MAKLTMQQQKVKCRARWALSGHAVASPAQQLLRLAGLRWGTAGQAAAGPWPWWVEASRRMRHHANFWRC